MMVLESAAALYNKVLDDVGRDHLIHNLVEHMCGVHEDIQGTVGLLTLLKSSFITMMIIIIR